MEEQTELWLSTIWKYKNAGVQRILDGLRSQHPHGHFSFDKETGWFRVFCDKTSAEKVQTAFRKIQNEIESGVWEKLTSSSTVGIPDNDWLTVPPPGELPPSPDHLSQTNLDHQSPAIFDKYKFSKVWTRLKDDAIATKSVASLLTPDTLKAVCAATGVFIAPGQADRLVYIGADSIDSISKACTMLDNILKRQMFCMPPPKHILHADVADGTIYHIDTRYMAHVNMGMLTSTIFDPAQYPQQPNDQLKEIFKAAFARAVCLRICVPDRLKRFEVSFFGPKALPAFEDTARVYPIWLDGAQYVSKTRGIPAPKRASSLTTSEPSLNSTPNSTRAPPNNNEPGFNGIVATTHKELFTQGPRAHSIPQTAQIDVGEVDLLGLGMEDVEDKHAPISDHNTKPAFPPEVEAAKVPFFPLSEDGKHGYELRMLWQFMNDPSPSTSKSASRNNSLSKTVEPERFEINSQVTNEKPMEEKLINFDDEIPVAPLIDMPSESDRDFGPLIPVPCQDLVLTKSPKTTGSASRHSALAESVRNEVMKLMADLPYTRGKIRLQAELGRIFIMDANPTGLAFNAPGEKASGWDPQDLLARLAATCVSPNSVVFSKGLSIFSNDIESMIGPIDLGSDTGNAPPGGVSPTAAWALHEKRVVYEFRCQRFYNSRDNKLIPQGPFVVEIDGTRPEDFSYSIRRIEDTRPPIWIHCIKRHWDARVVVSHSQTNKLEEMYGDFARELVRTLVVPGGPITTPKFVIDYDHREKTKDGRSFCTIIKSARVRNIARFIGNDDQSFLDVSWNRHMALEKRSGNADPLYGTFRGTPAVDDPVGGMFTSWYEVSISSARAEEAFRENETLSMGDGAAWGSDRAEQESMFTAIVDPALDLVRKMDGVGVLIDNGQGDMWTPPMRAPAAAGPVINAFW